MGHTRVGLVEVRLVRAIVQDMHGGVEIWELRDIEGTGGQER
jgi:hypothetical protein